MAPPSKTLTTTTDVPLATGHNDVYLGDPTVQPQTMTVETYVDLTQEYIAAVLTQNAPYLGGVIPLPRAIDDLERDFGVGQWGGVSIYSTMMHEPALSSSVGILLESALNQSPTYSPARKPHQDGAEMAQTIRDFCAYCMENLDGQPFEDTLYELIEGAFTHGNKLAEKQYEIDTPDGMDDTYLCLRALHTKPQASTVFCVDYFNNFLGAKYVVPGQPLQWAWFQPDPVTGRVKDLLDPEKIALCRYRPKNNSPQGTSALRETYHAWWLLQQVYESLKRYIAIYGTPPIVATLPPSVQDIIFDEKGVKLPVPIKPAKALLDNLKALRAAGIIVVQNGTTVEIKQPAGDGAVYAQAIQAQTARIVQSILRSTLATMEGAHQARAASQTHMNTLSVVVRNIRSWAERFVRYQLLRPMVELNFGRKYLPLTPLVSLGRTEPQDLAQLWNAFGNIYHSGAIQVDQLPESFRDLSLPESPTLEEQIRKIVANEIPAPVPAGGMGGNPQAPGPGGPSTPPYGYQDRQTQEQPQGVTA